MKHILVPTDFSSASRVAFQHAREQAQVFGPENTRITLLSVLEDLIPASVQFEFGLTFIDSKGLLEEAEKRARLKAAEYEKEFFSGLRIRSEVVRAAHPVHAEIIEYTTTHKVDLIIMATHGRTGVRRLVLGSVAEKVIRESLCPVLVVPAKEAPESLTTD